MSADRVRRELVKLHGAPAVSSRDGTTASDSIRLPISRPARAALEQSLREALRLRHAHLGVEHLLLALLREEAGAAVRILESLGVTAAAAEERVTELVAAGATRS